jgi:hypothetical protein
MAPVIYGRDPNASSSNEQLLKDVLSRELWVLGAQGRAGFEPLGSLRITVCDLITDTENMGLCLIVTHN